MDNNKTEVEIATDHRAMVSKLTKPGTSIMESMTPAKCDLLHMALGIAGEMGEVVDLVKKLVFYGKVIDNAKFVEEMGDVEFYLCGLRNALGITRKNVLLSNINKLETRYSSGSYSNKQAINRADKIEE